MTMRKLATSWTKSFQNFGHSLKSRTRSGVRSRDWEANESCQVQILESRPLLSVIPVAPEIEFTPVLTSGYDEYQDPAIASDFSGNSVVVWSGSTPSPLGTRAVFAQLLDSRGTPIGSQIIIKDSIIRDYSSVKSATAVAMDPNGNFAVTWNEQSGVYARCYNANGTPKGSAFRVGSGNVPYLASHAYPQIAMDAMGNFVIAWLSKYEGFETYGFLFQRFAPDGTPQGSTVEVATSSNSYISNPTLAMNSSGDFVIAALLYDPASSTSAIRAQQFDINGVSRGPWFNVVDNSNDNVNSPTVAIDLSGNFVVAWTKAVTLFDKDIFARRFNHLGVPQGTEFRVNSYTTNHQVYPHLTMTRDGNFVVSWTNLDVPVSSVRGQYFRGDGTSEGGELNINTSDVSNSGFGLQYSISTDGDGGLFAIWANRIDQPVSNVTKSLTYRRFMVSPDVPALESLPGAPATLYLDFNGNFESSWSQPWSTFQNIFTPVYSEDQDFHTFNSSEVDTITEIWKRVAEDFAPFNINVTTVEPLSFADKVGLRVAIGGYDTDWYKTAPAVLGTSSDIGAFSSPYKNTVYVFAQSILSNYSPGMFKKIIAETISHESGHAFGLQHQSLYDAGGNLLDVYSPGGNGWAPIMGESNFEDRTTWWNGTTSTSTTYEDEIAILSGPVNGFGYRPDLVGPDYATATPLGFVGPLFTGAGIIEKASDIDSFSFSTALSRRIALAVSPAAVGANLLVKIELRTSTGMLIATSVGGINQAATITTNLAPGDYQVRVMSDGTYGSLGQYSISGTLLDPFPLAIGSFRGGKFYLDVDSNRRWNNPTGFDASFSFGVTGDQPLAGDWNGDGNTEIGVFRSGKFYLDANANRKWDGPAGGDFIVSFGAVTDSPVIGDWNGDGIDDIGTFRNGQFFLDRNGNRRWDGVAGGDLLVSFGTTGDLPVIGDWNGDGISDVGIYRNGRFYLDANGNSVWNNISGGDAYFSFGTSGDKPIAGDWNADGKTDVGVVRGTTYYLDANGNRVWNNTTGGDSLFVFGASGDLPIVGNWKGAPGSPSLSAPSTTPASSVLDAVFASRTYPSGILSFNSINQSLISTANVQLTISEKKNDSLRKSKSFSEGLPLTRKSIARSTFSLLTGVDAGMAAIKKLSDIALKVT